MTGERLRQLLDRFPTLRVAVVGDFFVDKYLHIDPALEEVSIETGLPAHQVTAVRCQPGAAGTVTNNLSALDVGTIWAVGYRGDDGEGYELNRGLAATRVRTDHLVACPDRFTPTYTKPLVFEPGGPRELSRLDVKNRTPTPAAVEAKVVAALRAVADDVDAIIVGDQVEEANHGVVTDAVREMLGSLGRSRPELVIVADSRRHIDRFRDVIMKPNLNEAGAIILARGGRTTAQATPAELAEELRRLNGRPVFITLGAEGAYVADERESRHVPGVPVTGPIDIVGAGDSFCAGATATLAAGGTMVEAAMVGCLVASLTVQQIGTTGTTTRAEVVSRWEESPYRPHG